MTSFIESLTVGKLILVIVLGWASIYIGKIYTSRFHIEDIGASDGGMSAVCLPSSIFAVLIGIGIDEPVVNIIWATIVLFFSGFCMTFHIRDHINNFRNGPRILKIIYVSEIVVLLVMYTVSILFCVNDMNTPKRPEDCIGGDVVAVTTSPEGNHIHICKDGSEYVSIEEGYEYHTPMPRPTRTPEPEPSYDPEELAELEAMAKECAVEDAQLFGYYNYSDLAVAYYKTHIEFEYYEGFRDEILNNDNIDSDELSHWDSFDTLFLDVPKQEAIDFAKSKELYNYTDLALAWYDLKNLRDDLWRELDSLVEEYMADEEYYEG